MDQVGRRAFAEKSQLLERMMRTKHVAWPAADRAAGEQAAEQSGLAGLQTQSSVAIQPAQCIKLYIHKLHEHVKS